MTLHDYLYKTYAPGTARQYLIDINHYLKMAGDPQQATYSDIMAYLSILRNRYQRGTTVQRILAALKAYYQWLVESGQRSDHPCSSLRLRDRKDHRIQVQDLFTLKELQLLLQQEPSYWHGAVRGRSSIIGRNKVILALLIYQALSQRNIIELKVEDINLNQATIIIKATHTLNERILPLHPQQIMLVNRYLTKERPLLLNSDNPYLIITRRGNRETGCAVRKVVEGFKHLFPLKKLCAQSIRQSVIANLLKGGKDIRVVQVFAGHKSPRATERYRQSGVEELKAAVKKYHPLG